MEAALHKAPCPDAEKGPGLVAIQTKDSGVGHGRHITLVNRLFLFDLYQDLRVMPCRLVMCTLQPLFVYIRWDTPLGNQSYCLLSLDE